MKTGLHLGFFHLLSDEGKLNIKHAVNRQDKTTDAQDEFSKTYLFFKYSRNIPRYFKLDFFSTHLFFGRTKLIFFSFFIKDINSSLISRPGSCLFSILFLFRQFLSTQKYCPNKNFYYFEFHAKKCVCV